MARSTIDRAFAHLHAGNEPDEMTQIYARLRAEADKGGLLHELLETITDPWVLVPALIGWGLPLGRASLARKWKFFARRDAKEISERVLADGGGRFQVGTGDVPQVFAGTELGARWVDAVAEMSLSADRALKPLSDFYRRVGDAWTDLDDMLIIAKRRGLDRGPNAIFRKRIQLTPTQQEAYDLFDDMVRRTQKNKEIYTTKEGTQMVKYRGDAFKGAPKVEGNYTPDYIRRLDDQQVWDPFNMSQTAEQRADEFRRFIQQAAEGGGVKNINDMKRAVRTHVLPRAKGKAAPQLSPAQVDLIPDELLKPGIKDAVKQSAIDKHVQWMKSGNKTPPVSFLDLQASSIAKHMAHTEARANMWLITKRNGKTMEQLVEETLKAVKPSSMKGRMLLDSAVPQLLEMRSASAVAQAIRSRQNARRVWDGLTAVKEYGQRRGIPGLPGAADFLLKKMVDIGPGPHAMSRVAAGAIYAGTLGANIGSTALNLMQYFLTVAPTVGARNAVTGAVEWLKTVPKIASRWQKEYKLAWGSLDDAITDIVPEWGRLGLSKATRFQDDVRAFSHRLRNVPPQSRLAAVQDFLMRPFVMSEKGVRLAATLAFRDEARTLGMRGGVAMSHIRNGVARTQFVPGPGMVPSAFAPGGTFANPLAHQFLTFGTKAAGFAVGRDLTDNLDRLSRVGKMAAIGVAIGEHGSDMTGVDLERGMWLSAMPINTFSDSPLGMVPAPPAAQILAAPIYDMLHDTDWQHTRRSLGLPVPGFTAASRFVGTHGGPRIGQFLGKTYADYNRMDPETGKYAVHSSKGSLIGYLSPYQIWAKSLGLGSNDLNEERSNMQFLMKSREDLLQHKRDYLDAMFRNDTHAMIKVSEGFRQAYPMLGEIKQHIKKGDITAMEMRQEIPRLERQLQQLPTTMREPFMEAMMLALEQTAPDFLALPPSRLQEGTAKSRLPYRRGYSSRQLNYDEARAGLPTRAPGHREPQFVKYGGLAPG